MTPAESLDALAELKNLKNLSEDDKIRKVCQLERQLAAAKAAAKESNRKRQVVEADLQLSNDNLERLLATQDLVTVRKLEKSRKRKGRGKATAIICVNDWHCEENVDPEVLEGVHNEFNPRIAERRINTVWEKARYLLDFARGMSNIEEVCLWAGGDMISGYIHPELEESNFKGPTDAIMFVQEHLATGINHLLSDPKTKQLVFLSNYGNHGRTTKKRRISTGWRSSWEYLAYHNVAAKFAHDARFRYKIAKGYFNWFPIQGHDVRFHHGDAMRGGKGYAGIHAPVGKKIRDWNRTRRPAALDVFGHFHQYCEDICYVGCGSLIGYNAYAQSIAAQPQPPLQTLIVMDYEHGKVMVLPIHCEDKAVV